MEPRFCERDDGGRLAYYVFGSGPPLVCHGGLAFPVLDYFQDFAGLARHFTLIFVDTRGTGRSDPANDDSGYVYSALASDLESLRVAVGLDGLPLFAHASAVPTALVYAQAFPDRLAAVVLACGTGAPPSPERAKAMEALVMARAEEPWFADFLDAAVKIGSKDVPTTEYPRTLARYYQMLMHDPAAPEVRSFLERLCSHPTPGRQELFASDNVTDLRAKLNDTDAPVLLIVGVSDAGTLGRADAVEFSEIVPRARIVVLDRCGHGPWVEKPGEFGAAVTDFASGAASWPSAV